MVVVQAWVVYCTGGAVQIVWNDRHPGPFEQVEGPIHHRDIGESHGANVVVIVLDFREVVRFHTSADPVIRLEDVIPQVRNGKVIQDHGNIEPSCASSDNSDLRSGIEVDFWQVDILGKLQRSGQQRRLPWNYTVNQLIAAVKVHLLRQFSSDESSGPLSSERRRA